MFESVNVSLSSRGQYRQSNDHLPPLLQFRASSQSFADDLHDRGLHLGCHLQGCRWLTVAPPGNSPHPCSVD